jgi:hypothetical protein
LVVFEKGPICGVFLVYDDEQMKTNCCSGMTCLVSGRFRFVETGWYRSWPTAGDINPQIATRKSTDESLQLELPEKT